MTVTVVNLECFFILQENVSDRVRVRVRQSLSPICNCSTSAEGLMLCKCMWSIIQSMGGIRDHLAPCLSVSCFSSLRDVWTELQNSLAGSLCSFDIDNKAVASKAGARVISLEFFFVFWERWLPCADVTASYWKRADAVPTETAALFLQWYF